MSVEPDILLHYGGALRNDLKILIDSYLNDDDDIDNISLHSSPYYTFDGLISKLETLPNQMTIFSLHCQSINSKFDQILLLLNILSLNNIEVSVICLQETWLGEKADVSLFNIPHYKLIAQGKYSSKHAGLMIYIHEHISFEVVNVPIKPMTWEYVIVKLKTGIAKDIYLCNVYRPPKDYSESTVTSFTNEPNTIIHNLNQSNSNIIILGDFNIDLLKIEEYTHFKDYFLNLVGNGLLPTITYPTRLGHTSASLIDNIFTNISYNKDTSSSGILISDISDHFPFFFTFSSSFHKRLSSESVKCRKFDNASINHLYIELESINLYNFLNKDPYCDPNVNYEIFESKITELINKHIPQRKLKYNKYKYKKSNWITTGILKSIKYRDKLYKSMKKTPTNTVDFITKNTIYQYIIKF